MQLNNVSPAVRPLTLQDLKTLGLSSLGGALEFYDFIIFVFFTAVFGKVFFPPDIPEWLVAIQTFGIFAAGYLVRPIGGIALAHFGDLFGRKSAFAFSIMLMALSTLGMAALPTYGSIGMVAPVLLIVLRILQGAAIGGEVPGAWTFVSEHVPSRHVGFACGLIAAGLTLGILLGSLVATITNTFFSADEIVRYAWRLPFFLGGIFGLLAVLLRRWLQETPVFAELKQKRSLAAELPLKSVLRDHLKSIVISILLTWVVTAGIIVTTLMTPTLLQKVYGYTAQQSLSATTFGTLFVIIGAVAGGAIVDRVGSGRFFIGGSVLFATGTFTFYTYAGTSLAALFFLYAIMGMSVGIIAGVPYVMVRAFPAQVRFTGVSFSYNVAYAVFGGLTPLAIASLLPFSSMAHAYYLLFIAVLALAVGMYLVMWGDGVEAEVGLEEFAERFAAGS
ncbi:MFS transporter (plasmid) [Rhizobium sp. CC1099]|uniref:MFS transporter n=1 Tax=Rhizobium sp. CC1099 TaxID=3039160 RepID=UPI0024B166B6|nr:MFS transporter [Rhizobium sp. CC1099]WFU91382.1 MFS transporter [Rhizobium sp. CC1099]